MLTSEVIAPLRNLMALKVQCLLKQLEAFSLLFSCSIVRAIVNYLYLNWIYSIYFIRLNKKAKAKWILVAIEKWRHFLSWKWAVILSDERKRYILVIKWIQTLNPFFLLKQTWKHVNFFPFIYFWFLRIQWQLERYFWSVYFFAQQ